MSRASPNASESVSRCDGLRTRLRFPVAKGRIEMAGGNGDALHGGDNRRDGHGHAGGGGPPCPRSGTRRGIPIAWRRSKLSPGRRPRRSPADAGSPVVKTISPRRASSAFWRTAAVPTCGRTCAGPPAANSREDAGMRRRWTGARSARAACCGTPGSPGTPSSHRRVGSPDSAPTWLSSGGARDGRDALPVPSVMLPMSRPDSRRSSPGASSGSSFSPMWKGSRQERSRRFSGRPRGRRPSA